MALILYVVAEGMRLKVAGAGSGTEAARPAASPVGMVSRIDKSSDPYTANPAVFQACKSNLRPMVVVAGDGDVVECNQTAAAAGIRPGSSLQQAHSLCPNLQVLRLADDDPGLQRAADALCRVFYQLTPWVEPDGITSLFCRIPLSPAAGGFQEMKAALKAKATAFCTCHADRLTIGIATTRFEAKLLVHLVVQHDHTSLTSPVDTVRQPKASRREQASSVCTIVEDHLRLVLSPVVAAGLAGGGVVSFPVMPVNNWLRPLPVASLWPLPLAVRKRLYRIGLRTLGDVVDAGRLALATELGADGVRAFELASGIDRTQVKTGYPPREVTESRRLPAGAGSNQWDLERAAVHAATVMAERLLKAGEGAGQLWLVLESEDGHLFTASRDFSTVTARRSALEEAARKMVRESLNRIQFAVEKLHLSARRLMPLPVDQQSIWQAESAASAERQRRLHELIHQLRRRFPDDAARLGGQLSRTRRERLLAHWDPFRFGQSISV